MYTLTYKYNSITDVLSHVYIFFHHRIGTLLIDQYTELNYVQTNTMLLQTMLK